MFAFSQISGYAGRLMSGGTIEIVLLIILVVVALILFLVALWILWKLLVLLGKGLLWLFRKGAEVVQGRSQSMREARLAAPPAVATGWSSSPRIGLRRALMEARRLAGPDALRIVIVAGEGMSDICRSLGLTPPGVGTVGIAAGSNTMLIDASNADNQALRRLANALPWRRPVDAVAALVEPDGIPPDALARAANFARITGTRIAMHFVLPSSGKMTAWRTIDSRNQDGDEICSQLAADTVRIWLAGGSREGLKELALAQSRELPNALDRALAVAPSSIVDIASLSFSGAGLRAGVAQTVERTRPTSVPGLMMWGAVAILAVGIALAYLVAINGLARASALRAAVDTASREASASWTAEDIDAIPSGARVRRIAGLSARLADLSQFTPLMPLAPLVPNYSAPEKLGAAFLDGYVLRPLATALDRQTRERLAPGDMPRRWIEDARIVSEWFAAWEGLADDPLEVDLRRLFVAAFGGDQNAWAEGTELALVRTGVKPPTASQGGLDIDGLTELARSNFVVTMQRWADTVYTNGPVARAARQANDRSTNWREQHAALVDLRTALQDPSQQWLTAAEDRPDHRFELRVLGRAVGLALIGQVSAIEAKAAISRIRIDARGAAEYFILPKIGPIMVRSSTGGQGGGGASLSMTPEAVAWLAFLDRIANAGFADLPKVAPTPLVGLVTVDPVVVSEARRKLQIFDQFASDLPADLPPSVAQNLIRELASELVIGITISVEQALRIRNIKGIASEQAGRLASIAPSLDDLAEIEDWLRQRQAEDEGDRVLSVRARVAEGVLVASAGVLAEEDPLGIYLDPAADRNALVRRYERGLARMSRIHEQYAVPFIESATQGRGWAAVEWRNMAQDIAAHQRGDIDSVLSGLEGMLRAFAENPAEACDAPRVATVGRDDYLARALARFRAEFDYACSERNLAESRAAYLRIADYFNRHVAWLWPYSSDGTAPELAPSTLAEFATQLHAAREDLVRLNDPLAIDLAENAKFWALDNDGGAAVRFRIDWRARPSEEHLAENIIEFVIDGASLDEAGIYTWRYGAPLVLKIRLAKNALYRFVKANDPEQRELAVTSEGNGALLRVFSGLSNGALTFRAEVFDDENVRDMLRATARVTNADGVPMTLPKFSESAPLAALTSDALAPGQTTGRQ